MLSACIAIDGLELQLDVNEREAGIVAWGNLSYRWIPGTGETWLLIPGQDLGDPRRFLDRFLEAVKVGSSRPAIDLSPDDSATRALRRAWESGADQRQLDAHHAIKIADGAHGQLFFYPRADAFVLELSHADRTPCVIEVNPRELRSALEEVQKTVERYLSDREDADELR